MRRLTVFLGLSLLAAPPVSKAISKFDGTWTGTYNSQPTNLLPDDSYPEAVNNFELRLHESKGAVTGEFRQLGRARSFEEPIRNGRLFGDRACFDVVTEDDDMRWCISVRCPRLEGTWSRGPEGGPLLGGGGVGARLFKVGGIRQK